MLLEKNGLFNDLTPEFRKKLVERVKSFGKSVRYKFDISSKNPDPTNYNGITTIWPNVYTLDPTVFNIIDPDEKRDQHSRSKRIGLVESVDEKGTPNKFKKIRIHGRTKGVYTLQLEEGTEQFYMAMFMELHPKNKSGMFPDKTKRQMVERIDEELNATQQRTQRTARLKALNAAQSMSDKEVVNFADAMMWDSGIQVNVLRNMIEELADTQPEFFNDLVDGKSVEYQALVKQALDKKVIEFDPAEYKIIWAGNRQTITVLSPAGDSNHVQKTAEWLQTGGEKADEVYKKMKGLVKS